MILLPEDRSRYEYITRLSGDGTDDHVEQNGELSSASTEDYGNRKEDAVPNELRNANSTYPEAYSGGFERKQRNKEAVSTQTSANQPHSPRAAPVKSVNLDDMVEEAFKNQKPADHICIMRYTAGYRAEFLKELLGRLGEHKRKTKNAPHVLYVDRFPHNLKAIRESHKQEMDDFGKVNTISKRKISIAPNNLFTIAELVELSLVYHAINTYGEERAAELLEHLRNMRLHDKIVEYDLCEEEAFADEASAGTPENDAKAVTELSFKGAPVDETNQEEFAAVLRSLIESFFLSHDEVANRDWNYDGVFAPQKETLISARRLLQSTYHSAAQLADRLQINEPSKRIVILDGFAPRYFPTEATHGTALFDLVMTAMRKECQIAAMSYQLFNPQNVAQWMRRNIGPADFGVAAQFPECRVFKDDWHFNPFENGATPTYGIAEVNFLRKVLAENHLCPRTLFHKPIKDTTPSNWPINKQFEAMLKDILKQAMLINGIDTMHKLKHHSRGTYDYVKQYLPGGKGHRPAEKIGESGATVYGASDEAPQSTEQPDDTESMTIDDLLDQVIDLGRRHGAVKLMQKLNLNSAIQSMSNQVAKSVIDRVMKDGIYPTVIFARHADVEEYKPVLLENFEPIQEMENLVKEYALDSGDVEYLKRGVACLGRNVHPLTEDFVKRHLHMFKVVVTFLGLRGARHYVCQYPMDQRLNNIQTLRYPAPLLSTVLGAERLSFYGMPPSSTLNALSSLLSTIPTDYRWFVPLAALKHSMAHLPEAVMSNPKLASSFEKGTFAKFMMDCSDAYVDRNDGVFNAASDGTEKVNCCTELYRRRGNTSYTSALAKVPSHKWEENVLYYGSNGYRTSRKYANQSAENPEQRYHTHGQPRQPASRTRAQTQSPAYTADHVLRNRRPQSVPSMRSMLDRQVHLKSFEGRLTKLGVYMRPFYTLDQKWKRVAKFRSYLRNHIRGMLMHKGKAIHMLNTATSLHGADVLGMDDKHYTIMWVGTPARCTVPNHSLSERVWHAMRKLFEENSHHMYFAVLKAENGGYLCVPSMFIKDICEISNTVEPVRGAILLSRPAEIALSPKEGVPQDAMVDRLRYLVMTDKEGNEAEMLPSRMEAASFLPSATLELVRIGIETVERYKAVEERLTEDAVKKMLESPESGITTRDKALHMLRTTRSIYANRALGGLEQHLRQRQAQQRTWGRVPRSPADMLYY
ncbi:hypothetical protein, conserved [Babesia bigemina]|uniref:Uncharacterized protein n=1 Tax=Babesia bigemina TaxID=5866 RepID=A0A061DCP0_BABBI|nr:hypothetical protein, conserved [Babesia bigemina]CDR95690.1 hypothetical protein, conserved [Babesia bigemina]|eukprot:XP_012767876.1 hypothetical protein, conserved [Babesia bigemina]